MTYYTRPTTTKNSDGTPLYAVGYDKENEEAVCKLLSEKWKCEIHPFGRLCPLDFYALKDGRLVGVLELKSKSYPHDKYKVAYLNVRKWLALVLAENGLGCPGIFVVKFSNEVRFIPVAKVNASKVKIGGCKEIVKSHTDIEPVIEVPVMSMSVIK
jgi:hypothetical protein